MTANAMTRAEIDAALHESGVGVLSLTDGAETYAIPESFGYDGENLYFQFAYEEGSQKMAFAETTDLATLTVFSERPAWSVVVRGDIAPLSEVDAPEAADAIASNAAVPQFNVSPDSPAQDLQFDPYRLTPTERSGRAFGSIDGSTETF
ncbi:pyridoxamine 5'-phosphate oxidase family protein [Haloplanus salilacus]|uniref:pyridoxamine 5'-phosphate oxidase family protein n=1 Tax=Haloplanus salilacus TaxID=2949994 RepID=UPI0030D2E15C